MDDDKPTFQIVQKGFFETKKGKLVLATGVGIILFVILAVSLTYFDVISPSKLTSLLKKSTPATGSPVKITLISENYGFVAGELTLDCPVESSFCPSRKLVSANKQDTVVYKAASGSGVLKLTTAPSLENIAVSAYPETGKKYFYESTISKDGQSCYTIAYSLPIDAEFGNLSNLASLAQDLPFAILGSKTFQLEGEEANVLIQVRNTPMDPGKACSLFQKSPEFFKNF